MNDAYRMLRGAANGYIRTGAGTARLIATRLPPRGTCRLYAADTAQCLCEGIADDRGALDVAYTESAGGVCLLVNGRPALWTEGCDAVALSLLVAGAARKKGGKRYRLIADRRFPRRKNPPPARKPSYRLRLGRRFPRPDKSPPPAKKTPRFILLADRRYARARKLRAPSDAPALGALPALRWGGAAKWAPYFHLLIPCAPTDDRAWRFVRARTADGGECYLGMRAERDEVSEIVALAGQTRFSLYKKDN